MAVGVHGGSPGLPPLTTSSSSAVNSRTVLNSRIGLMVSAMAIPCSASPSVHAVPGVRDARTHTVHKTLKKTEIFNSDESDSTSLMQATPLRPLGRATAGWSPPKRRTCRRIAKQSVPRQSSPLVGEGRVWGSRFVAHAPRNHKKENEARRLVFELRQLLCTPTTIAACPPRTGL